jgi:hypothetical protein
MQPLDEALPAGVPTTLAPPPRLRVGRRRRGPARRPCEGCSAQVGGAGVRRRVRRERVTGAGRGGPAAGSTQPWVSLRRLPCQRTVDHPGEGVEWAREQPEERQRGEGHGGRERAWAAPRHRESKGERRKEQRRGGPCGGEGWGGGVQARGEGGVRGGPKRPPPQGGWPFVSVVEAWITQLNAPHAARRVTHRSTRTARRGTSEWQAPPAPRRGGRGSAAAARPQG